MPYRNGFYYSTSDSYEVSYFVDGARIRVIRGEDRDQRRVTPQDVEHYADSLVEDWTRDGIGQLAAQLLLDIAYPETFPSLSQLLVDTRGRLWVAEYARARQPMWRRYSIVETDDLRDGLAKVLAFRTRPTAASKGA